MSIERWSHFRDGRSEIPPDGEWVKFEEHESRSGYFDDAREGTEIVPDAKPAEVFLQYKNTDACFDFTCPACGYEGHFDGYFAYIVRCKCGAAYEMPPFLYPRRVEVTDGGAVIDLESGESLPISQFGGEGEDMSLPAGCLSTCDWRGGPIHAPGCPNT